MAATATVSGDDVEGSADDTSTARSSLRYIGEIVSVGPQLTARWMDGTMGTLEPEEAYVVNTEEDEEAL